jgi:heme/copper-type cytochrome/quinol oxidase subunit 2
MPYPIDHAKADEPVIVEFITADVNAGSRAPDLGLRTDIFPGV